MLARSFTFVIVIVAIAIALMNVAAIAVIAVAVVAIAVVTIAVVAIIVIAVVIFLVIIVIVVITTHASLKLSGEMSFSTFLLSRAKRRIFAGTRQFSSSPSIGRTIVTRQWLKPLLSDTKLDGSFTHYYYPAAAVSLVVEHHRKQRMGAGNCAEGWKWHVHQVQHHENQEGR